jgi:hypothetical protein
MLGKGRARGEGVLLMVGGLMNSWCGFNAIANAVEPRENPSSTVENFPQTSSRDGHHVLGKWSCHILAESNLSILRRVKWLNPQNTRLVSLPLLAGKSSAT